MKEYINELQTMISKNQYPDMGGKNNIDHRSALNLLLLIHNEYEKITSNNSQSNPCLSCKNVYSALCLQCCHVANNYYKPK